NLFPLASQWDNCYKIRSPYSNEEYFILEYRQKTGLFENNLPGSGLLAYKIDPVFNGNSTGPPDEVYLFRPGGSCTENGEPSLAYNSYESGRTALNDTTETNGFLGSCSPAGLMISNITSAGPSISFSVRISNVEPPSAFSATAAGTNSVYLNWSLNPNGNSVLLVSGINNDIGNPMMGVSYTAGDPLPGGGTVIYCGPASNFEQTGLSSNSLYFYKIWSFEPGYLYSRGITSFCYTDCSCIMLPYYEAIQASWLPSCWEIQSSDETAQIWRISNTSEAGGEPYELMIASNIISIDYSRMILPPINTIGITQLGLSFRFNFLDQYQGTTIKIQTSNDKVNWTDAGWSVNSVYNNPHAPQVIQTSITTNLDSPVTYVAISIEGSLWAFSGVYFDDFEMYIEECNFYQVFASAVPSEGGTVSGAGHFYPGQEVALHAQPVQGWNFIGWKENGQWISDTPDYFFLAGGDRNISAWFSQSQIRVSAIVTPESSGGCEGVGLFDLFSPVDMNAIPAEGFEFDHWEENGQIVSGTASYSFTALNSRYFTAVFRPSVFNVYAQAVPVGTGLVQGTGSFEIHHTANLVATPLDGYQFIGWFENGNLLSALSELSFEVTTERNLEARFYCPACNIVAVASPVEAGSIEGGGAYSGGETAVVKATPGNSWVFKNWTENGIQVSGLPEYSFVVERYRDLVAHFLKIYNVQVTVTPVGSGSIIGDGQFVDGTAITLGAFPNEYFEFSCWKEGDDTLSTTNVLNFIVQSNRDIRAVFKKTNGFRELSGPGIRIYPSPAKSILFLEITGGAISANPMIQVYDLTSRCWQLPMEALSNEVYSIDISGLAAGTYFLRMLSPEGKSLGTGCFIVGK
ncbi:MAG: T9SS type A sorting domain-containing protein, partial [Bacteroidales bacterium]|nr:T9SS type A sorting domain-containing protein [Bacteroidales bacterium]